MSGEVHIVMTLRVDFLYPRLDPRVYKEAKELVNRGYDVTVLCWSREDSGHPRFEEYEGIKIERVKHTIPPPDSSRILKGPPYFKLIRNMVKAIKAHKPDVLHAHDADTLLESSFAHKSLKMPFIYDSHEDYPAMVVQRYPMLAMGTKFLEKWLVGNVDHVIAATGGIGKKFQGMDKPTTVVYNSRREEDFVKITAKERRKLRASLGFGPGDFVVGYAGVLGKTHNTDLMIQIVSRMDPKSSNIKLLFIGGPDVQYERTRKMVQDMNMGKRVSVLPMMSFNDIMKYYQTMDAGTIIYEPSPNLIVAAPNKLFEFMGFGIPMIAQDYPEMRNILVEHGEASILVDPSNMKAVKAAMETLAGDPELCKQYSKKLKDLMRTRYNWSLQRRKLYQVYDALL
ncbi:MAG: glycosyltransferase family 4 protein [Thermoplasmata archaeon]|nr:MAG: glycosyltransferase family 4 protein [Thermoplasmata archaeon]